MKSEDFFFKPHGKQPIYFAIELGEYILGCVMTNDIKDLYSVKLWAKKRFPQWGEKDYHEIIRTPFFEFQLSLMQHNIVNKMFNEEFKGLI